ncbi:hypothetical protein M422DRAFT_167344 [Sphaerobolus stellatus SS14]|uniref:CBS domain-containing protein n=1 Tax=Sphaerobolus stellatus (strain SS14) TaxID=990650 RepID=A0A0C9UQF4_SPHS4|nr:hypothetical protein M422DRAFT_167344 [Sphaerobolus stellatus SS14]
MSAATPLSPTSPKQMRRKGSTRRARAGSHLPPPQTQETHDAALNAIRLFLKGRSSYDVFPLSSRVIVLDTKLEVKKALTCVVSAPLWNSEQRSFAGMLTVSDIIHLIQYYYWTVSSFDRAAAEVEEFRLESLREIERKLNVPPPPLLSIHPMQPLYEACKMLIKTHARRLPLLDLDSQTGDEAVISVLTQYRLLKFIAINCKEIHGLHMPLRKLNIGTYVTPTSENPYHPICWATVKTTVFDVVHMFSERGISAVPILDDDGVVINLYETVDVITLVRLGAYHSLDYDISMALSQRSPDFPGVVVCSGSDSLATLLALIAKRRVHRLVVVEGGRKGRLLGIITLSDVLRYVIGETGLGDGLPVTEEDVDG